MLRTAALGLATTAVAIQTVRWLLNKRRADSPRGSPESSPSKDIVDQEAAPAAVSPFRKASLEVVGTPSTGTPAAGSLSTGTERIASAVSPSETEPANSPQIKRARRNGGGGSASYTPKSIHFSDLPSANPCEEQQPSSARVYRPSGDYSSSEGEGPFSLDARGLADAAVHVQTPDSAKGDATFLGAFSPKLAAIEARRSPYDVSTGWPSPSLQDEASTTNGVSRRDGPALHIKQPSFPEVDYQPETSNFGSHYAGGFSMAPAPTEEGDAIARVEEVLADLEEQAMLGAKRHSRSFSEPNLAAQVVKQQLQQQAQAASPVNSPSSEEGEEFAASSFRERDSGAAALDGGEEYGNHEACSINGGASSSNDTPRGRSGNEPPPLLRLEILSGPSSGREITIDDANAQVTVGRFPDNYLFIEDREVSGKHALLNWDSSRWVWQVRDMGSMNGTRLNGNFISNAARRPGKHYQLSSDDILLLGSRTAIKIVYLPNAALPQLPQNLKRLCAPATSLRPTLTIKSEAMADLRAELNAEKSFQEEQLRLQGAVICRRGVEHQRTGSACEDVPFCGEAGRHQAALYCVFDGHIGRKSASSCTKLLPEELRERMGQLRPRLDSGEGVGQAWEEVFLNTDSALERTAPTEDGTTATALLVWRDKSGNLCLESANVGDSAAVFCYSHKDPTKDTVKMTVDHRISDPGEKKRLAAMGIELGRNKTRLYGLNLSRCLGDHFIKDADLGFIAVPSISEVVRLSPQQSGLVVIASDGLWDVAEPGRVMQVAFNAQRQPGSTPETVSEAIYQHAMKQRSRDDVCIIVLSLTASEQ